MWRSFFLAALRNLGRNRLHGALTIASLGLALAVVILLGLVVRNEWRFDRFLPGMDKTYLVVLSAAVPGAPPVTTDKIPVQTADWLRADFPGVATVARMVYGRLYIAAADGRAVPPPGFGFRDALVSAASVDPAFFDALPLPVVHGDLAGTAQAPDTVVISESLARTYFHTADAVGHHLSLTAPLALTARVGAVLRDLPPESHLNGAIFMTGPLAAGQFAAFAADRSCKGCIGSGAATYVRLKPGIAPQAVARWLETQLPVRDADLAATLRGGRARFELVPVSDLHRRADIPQPTYTVSMSLFLAISGFAGLVLIMAGGNFVLLMIARGTARGVEIGVRTALGARRRDLVLQLVAEAALYALAGTVLGMAMVEQALPLVNRAIGRAIALDGWADGAVVLGLFALLCLIGIGAGMWPALALAARSPVRLLRDPLAGGRAIEGRGHVRSVLVAVQFATLASLLLISIVFYRQIALEMATQAMDAVNVLVVARAPPGLDAPITALPGVAAIGRSSMPALFDNAPDVRVDGGRRSGSVVFRVVDRRFFGLYGISPLAGSLAARPGTVVLNRSAVRALGFAGPAAAIGRPLRFADRGGATWGGVVSGIIPDATLSAAQGAPPAAYQVGDGPLDLLSVKVRPGAEAGVERAIEALWAKQSSGPMTGYAIADMRRTGTAPIRSLAHLLAAITAAGGVIAVVGLFQLSAHSARRRAREIALRQAFGAGPWTAVRLAIGDQTPPVLLAILVAWPVAALLTAPWLHDFAHHIVVGPVTVLLAGVGILGIAWLTTGLHALWIGMAKPGRVLRYE
jgi:putative ABC transport system permease protein